MLKKHGESRGWNRRTMVILNGFCLFVRMNLSKIQKFGEIFFFVLTLVS